MFNLGEAETCVCKRKGNPSNCCDGELRFQEKGKKVTQYFSCKLRLKDLFCLSN